LAKNLAVKSTPFEIIMLKKYLVEKAENFISISRTHAGKNKKKVCQNVYLFFTYSYLIQIIPPPATALTCILDTLLVGNRSKIL
jgi:hypothetical protein